MATTPVVVTPIPDFPALSDRADGTYNSKAFAWATHMSGTFVPEVNAAVGAMSSFAAGGAYAFQYAFDSATANADPGVGKLRLGSATQNVSTALRIDNAMSGGADLSQVWADLLTVASSVKGSLRIVNSSDVSKWMVLDVTGFTAATGYRDLTVSVRASSDANPFTNGDPLMVYLQRAGDVSSGAQIKIAEAVISTPAALINFLNVFRADCDRYVIEVAGLALSAAGTLSLRVSTNGVSANTTGYTGSSVVGGGTAGSASTNPSFQLAAYRQGAGTASHAMSSTIDIRNARDGSGTLKSLTNIGMIRDAGSPGTYQHTGMSCGFVGSALRGFQLSIEDAGVNFTAGSVRVYGILN